MFPRTPTPNSFRAEAVPGPNREISSVSRRLLKPRVVPMVLNTCSGDSSVTQVEYVALCSALRHPMQGLRVSHTQMFCVTKADGHNK
jgi:hypothetical protein